MELAEKTVLITGSCGEGMGRSIALRLAREGANIVLNYGTHRRDEDVQAHAERIAEAVRELGGQAIIQPADTTDEQQVEGMVNATEAARGDYSTWQQRESPTCHDIAEIIVFLCSEAGRFISGSTIRLPTG